MMWENCVRNVVENDHQNPNAISKQRFRDFVRIECSACFLIYLESQISFTLDPFDKIMGKE
jgi:hypothetical protein